ncbi:nucleoside/nucleotide kinase family protein [Cellulomonas fengjieae]|uniref:Nucleoside/nucleotide kinase family protein n=1 Tax=Cellulomonas fengjieae TaxID=2819978 RepID=A0ABS3SJ18_9CELL|nr:nucleoside/nucleotide kinase family protein [Cellulomonas fengjieae]MBO3085749.1 nucleoside/nucleotide kinase family protein [Cellulomonas fengjieae]QVI67543.1 nucleoside/nucleotide kinase family protein [Cellulomonas fengjieae]
MVTNVDTTSPAVAAPDPVRELSVDDLIERARALARPGRRTVLGITGAPGAGKSTVCAALLDALGDDAVLVGMDGFHLADDELVRLGRRGRKGAPDTFDVGGYVALLRRLRPQADAVVYAPRFDRGLEAAIAGAVPIDVETPLVVTEGNYLLLDDLGWDAVRPCLDEAWFLDVQPHVRSERLEARRRSHGDSPDDARAWVANVDTANGLIVEATRTKADLVARLTPVPTPPKER